MSLASYFLPLIGLPTLITGPGRYLTRRGDIVTVVCWESMPDGSDPVRLSYTILAF
jgi:hypothetical protein